MMRGGGGYANSSRSRMNGSVNPNQNYLQNDARRRRLRELEQIENERQCEPESELPSEWRLSPADAVAESLWSEPEPEWEPEPELARYEQRPKGPMPSCHVFERAQHSAAPRCAVLDLRESGPLPIWRQMPMAALRSGDGAVRADDVRDQLARPQSRQKSVDGQIAGRARGHKGQGRG